MSTPGSFRVLLALSPVVTFGNTCYLFFRCIPKTLGSWAYKPRLVTGIDRPPKSPEMSARGARSRKVQQKDVEKKEKKVGKTRATEPGDAFADWRTTPTVDNPRRGVTRSQTVSSRATSRSSGTNDSNQRPRLTTVYSSNSSDVKAAQSSGGGSASISDVSTTGKEKTRFQANGKETKAPRGRGGGVPIKRTIAPSPAPPHFRAESAASHPSSNQKTWLNFKVWNGSKDAMRPYGGFDFVSTSRLARRYL